MLRDFKLCKEMECPHLKKHWDSCYGILYYYYFCNISGWQNERLSETEWNKYRVPFDCKFIKEYKLIFMVTPDEDKR